MKLNLDFDVDYTDRCNPAAAIHHINQEVLEQAALRCLSLKSVNESKDVAIERMKSKYILLQTRNQIEFDLIYGILLTHFFSFLHLECVQDPRCLMFQEKYHYYRHGLKDT